MTDTATPMAENASIALICPKCGYKSAELIAHLRLRYRYGCKSPEGCSYVFDFNNSEYGPLIQKIAELCDQFDTTANRGK